MLKALILFGSLAITLVSCDVRNKDKMAKITGEQTTAKPAAELPKTTVQLIDSAYDFGKVTDGEVVTFSYRFKNTGNNPLIVSNATASCGCTVPEKPEQPILPGETGFIKVKFNSENRVGPAHKSVTVSANVDPAFPEILLTGEVVAKAKN